MLHETRWTAPKITKRLEIISPLVYRKTQELPPFRFQYLSSPRDVSFVGADVDDSAWEIIPPNSYWGEWQRDYILRTHFQTPPEWSTKSPTVLYLPLGQSGDFSHPEALTYIDGTAYVSCDRHHQEFLLPPEWCDGQPHLLALHGWTGLGGWAVNPPKTKLFMRACLLAQIDVPTRELVTLTRVALGVVEQLDANNPVHGRLLNALDNAFNLLDLREPMADEFYASVPPALEALRGGIEKAGEPLDVDVIATGHAHIDVAWLWTLDQTRNKAARTFSNVLRLMEQFPDFHFTQSQPQLYQFIEQDYPELFEQIRQRVAEGRWELIGGTWVEPDCNASGAESLARQFMIGRSYFRQHFGDIDTLTFWLPDTFGYPWALPQLIKQAGMEYFITHKISWNQYNRLPYQSFWWQGIDGTRVLTHFMTTPAPDIDVFLPFATTYNAEQRPKEIVGTWRNYLQKEHHDELLTVFGYGDGGGGPTREMLENSHEMARFPGIPRTRPGSVREFMDGLLEKAGDRLPVWNGELYLEYHRGTFTSQSRTKRLNRKNEFLLHDAEFLAAWAALEGDDYPHELLRQAWELVCLNQFHDILPGSSIGPVYVDSTRQLEWVREQAVQIRDGALASLARRLPESADYMVVNPTSFGGRHVAFLAEAVSGTLTDVETGALMLTQAVDGGTLIDLPSSAAYSIGALASTEQSAALPESTLSAQENEGRFILENAVLRLEFAASGNLARLYDKEAGREVLAEGEEGNVLAVFEDLPLNFDAWDIDIFYTEKRWEVDPAQSIRIIETGAIRVGLDIERHVRSSTIRQRVYLYRDSRRVDFDTWVDWHEHHLLLKVAFPVNVLSPTATYEIQWGNIERPTYQNTSWDWARFENCGYKWVDLSEGDYGVSLLNDCKYGHDIHDNVIRLTLLKGATSPDPDADQGEHRLTYSLLPHAGNWRSETAAAAYDLNNPVIVRRATPSGSDLLDAVQLLSVDQPNIIIETVKQAEDGQGIIVRFYESQRRRGTVALHTGFRIQSAYICNLLEENERQLEVNEQLSIRLSVTPYQIVSLRIIPA